MNLVRLISKSIDHGFHPTRKLSTAGFQIFYRLFIDPELASISPMWIFDAQLLTSESEGIVINLLKGNVL